VTQEPEQKGERRVVVEHASNPKVLIGYHIPAAPHPDNYPIQALMALLGQGRTSRLFKIYQDLELTSSAPEVSNGPGDKLDNLLIIEATPRHPHTTEEVESAIYNEIEALKNEPPAEHELQRIRNKIDAAMVRTLGNNMGIAFNVGMYAFSRGDWRAYLTDNEKVKQVKPEDVSYVAGEYLTPRNRTVATLVKVEEEEKPESRPEEVDMQALINFVRTLPEAEQREIFMKVQSMSPSEQEQFAEEIAARMKAAQTKSTEGKASNPEAGSKDKEAQGEE
jgi:predicted Zn-dependent peptidase